MTKEEEIILDKDCFLHNHKWYYENDIVIKCMQGYSDQQNKELKEIVIQLQKDFVLKLEEVKKQECIAFNTWTVNNQWEYLMWGADRGSGWHKARDYKSDPISDETLYELFISQK